MKMGLFEGLSMVSLRVRETKQTFLQEITVQSFSKLSPKICEIKGNPILLFVPEDKRDVLKTV